MAGSDAALMTSVAYMQNRHCNIILTKKMTA